MQTLTQFPKMTAPTLPQQEIPEIEGRYVYLVRATEAFTGRKIKPLFRRTMRSAEISHACLIDLGYIDVRINPVRKP